MEEIEENLKKETLRRVKNILVTGGAGFIGSAFIRYLLTEVADFNGLVINYDLLTYAGNLENLKEIESDPRYIFKQGDIANEPLVEHLCLEHEIDTIIHFAAESHVDRSILGPKAFLETNILGTFHLLEVVRKNPSIHFHHVSTDEVYGSLGETGFFTETTAYSPNSPYSASKASSDHLVRAYGETYHLSTTISNCSNNYGPYHFPEKLIPLTILNCLNEKAIPIYGSGTNIRDWLFVEDHVEALYLILTRGKRGETYNIGGECEKKNKEIIELIIDLLDREGVRERKNLEKLIHHVKDRPGHDFRYAIDCSKIKEALGWSPKTTLENGMKKTIDWYLENSEWVDNIQSGNYREWIEKQYGKV